MFQTEESLEKVGNQNWKFSTRNCVGKVTCTVGVVGDEVGMAPFDVVPPDTTTVSCLIFTTPCTGGGGSLVWWGCCCCCCWEEGEEEDEEAVAPEAVAATYSAVGSEGVRCWNYNIVFILIAELILLLKLQHPTFCTIHKLLVEKLSRHFFWRCCIQFKKEFLLIECSKILRTCNQLSVYLS